MGGRLEVRGLTVELGATVAVDGVDLEVGDGEIVAVLGPSGCGKTTLLRAIAGLVRPAAGTIVLDGAVLTAVPVHRRGVGLMFQDQALFPHRDVAGNVGFGLRMRGERGAPVSARIAEMLRLVGLAGFERRAIGSLSGGEQQRVALARALAPEPRLLLLDEPLGGLDRALRDRLVRDLGHVIRNRAVTAVFVTHDQAEAFAIADRVVLMRAGRIVQAGRPHEVWQHPVDAAAAALLGAGTLVPGTVEDHVLRTPVGEFVAPALPDGPAVAVVRPAAARIDTTATGRCPGTVRQVRFAGDQVLVTVATDAGPDLDAAIDVDASGGATDLPGVGDRVEVSLDPSWIVVVPV